MRWFRHLVRKHLGVHLEELEEVAAREKKVWASLLKLLPLPSKSG